MVEEEEDGEKVHASHKPVASDGARSRGGGKSPLSPNESKTRFGRRGRASWQRYLADMLSDVINRPRRFHFIRRTVDIFANYKLPCVQESLVTNKLL